MDGANCVKYLPIRRFSFSRRLFAGEDCVDHALFVAFLMHPIYNN